MSFGCTLSGCGFVFPPLCGRRFGASPTDGPSPEPVVVSLVVVVVVVVAGGAVWTAATAVPIWISLPAGSPPWSAVSFRSSSVTAVLYPFDPAGALVSTLDAAMVSSTPVSDCDLAACHRLALRRGG